MNQLGFIRNSQLDKFIQNELNFANVMLSELVSLNSNFTGLPISKHCTSRFIATWLSKIFNIFYVETQPVQDLTKNIDSIIYALRYIGTDASFTKLFKTFLNVDIEITVPSDGVINIKLLGAIKTNFTAKISPSSTTNRNRKIKLCYKKENENIQCKILTFHFLPKGYAESIYSFLKNLIPIGRALRLYDMENKEIAKFNI
ncbi:DUF735 family protein [Borrelia turicatae]|uniref:DUF735 family protein n=1 Tax=Borrelia turicatae TaxID=142 RepID=UPI001FF41DB2|nr:DUF735 family protein [Borrelia turicatae]UPA13785.1 DUF735 family protein [Borrelia turicatae 91E135]UPA13830.1 DUF735 family protein [Borrelia turicatae 91E135]UPA13844.1 DUF735 family protein [Borrelia turicatae 91E135]UPA13887.1 DUF735 family protein [Borrelia turicatae 91E135]UPA15225.1 DUF735 family protein [Borrelia turicatae]